MRPFAVPQTARPKFIFNLYIYSFRAYFSGQLGIEFGSIDDESMVGSLGYLVNAVISNDRKEKFAAFHFFQLNLYNNRQAGWCRC